MLGISSNVRFSQKAFADSLKLNYPLLSDYRGHKVKKAYGVFDAKKRHGTKRSYFIVDKQGIIRFKRIISSKRGLVTTEELLKEIKKIN